MGNWVKSHHDIGITNVGSAGAGTDVIGMMLAEREDGTPAYEEYDGSFLASQFFTGVPSQDYTNPEEELIISQDDWRSGFGLETYDPRDTKRYFSSIGCDARFRGMMMAGPTPTVALQWRNLILNYGLESWASAVDCNNWTEVKGGTSSIDREATQVHSGTYSAKLTSAGDGSVYLAQSISFDNSLRSLEVTATCWAKTSTANLIYIEIADAVSGDTSAKHTGGGAWEQLTVTYTLNAGATEFTINLVGAAAVAGFGYVDDVEVLTPAGVTTVHEEFNDLLYYNVGQFLFKMNASGVHSFIKTMPATITSMVAMTVGGVAYLFIALGTSTDYQYMVAAETFTTSNAAVKQFQFFCLVHTTAPTMYGNDSVNTIRSTVDPLNAGTAWSNPATTVGSSFHAITEMFQKSGALYIPKEDMIYYLDSTGAVQNDLAPRLQALTSSTSGKNAMTDGQIIMYPAGSQGLLEIDTATTSATLTWRNPSDYCTNLSDFVGRVQALGYDETYWFAIVDNSTKVEVLAGRLESVDGSTSWVWHPIAEITMTNCGTAWVSSIYQKRLWISSSTHGENLYYIPLPTGYGDMQSDANRKFKTGTTFETSWLHGNFRADNKAWIKLTLTMGHTFNAGRYFTVAYKELGGAYVSIGNFTGSATSMVQSRFIDVTNKPFSSMIRLRFTAVTDDTDYTPVLTNYDARAILYPKPRRIIHCVVRCAQEVLRKDKNIDKGMYGTIKATLDNARSNAVWPVSIRDIDGSTVNVKFLPVPRDLKRLMITRKEEKRVQERHYHILLMEVPLS